LYLTPAVRKLTAIALICLLCFNWYGYRIVIHYLGTSIDASLQAQLDRNQYDEKELIELRVPINLPYITDWSEFEVYEGETTINGEHYRYVKRKVVNGELILLCVPNKNKTQLKKAGQEYYKQVAEAQQVPGKKTSAKDNLVKTFSSDLACFDENWPSAFNCSALSFFAAQQPALSSQAITPPAQPPDGNA